MMGMLKFATGLASLARGQVLGIAYAAAFALGATLMDEPVSTMWWCTAALLAALAALAMWKSRAWTPAPREGVGDERGRRTAPREGTATWDS